MREQVAGAGIERIGEGFTRWSGQFIFGGFKGGEEVGDGFGAQEEVGGGGLADQVLILGVAASRVAPSGRPLCSARI